MTSEIIANCCQTVCISIQLLESQYSGFNMLHTEAGVIELTEIISIRFELIGPNQGDSPLTLLW